MDSSYKFILKPSNVPAYTGKHKERGIWSNELSFALVYNVPIRSTAGFAAFHAAFPSKLALLCCLYAGGYEAYFVVSGTVSDERVSKISDQLGNAGIPLLKEQVARSKADYERVNSRYNSPGSKEHRNGWFKKNFVDPKWDAYSSSQEKLSEALTKFESQVAFDHVGLLKIFYRLGLVVLLMLFVHQAFRFNTSRKAYP